MIAVSRVLCWLRGPWIADDPTPDLSWLDRADGLDTPPIPLNLRES